MPLKFVKSKTVMILITQDAEDLDVTKLMKGIQYLFKKAKFHKLNLIKHMHVGHNEYPIIPQIVNVNLCSDAPKDGTVSYCCGFSFVFFPLFP